MIGDKDQLPPVGPGQVFKDLLETHNVPTAYLTFNFRQIEGSNIIKLADNVQKGHLPKLSGLTSGGDVKFYKELDEYKVQDLVIDLYLEKLPQDYGLSPIDDIQILCPQSTGRAGYSDLNRLIQRRLSVGKKPLEERKNKGDNDHYLFKGDKVMQTKNDYDLNVMNGDIGHIIRGGDKIIVNMSGREVEYDKKTVSNIELAYAISIHKSQGSEYAAVIIPVVSSHQFMLGRNFLYTAITRGKKHVIIVGDEKAFDSGIKAQWKDYRYTLLRHMV